MVNETKKSLESSDNIKSVVKAIHQGVELATADYTPPEPSLDELVDGQRRLKGLLRNLNTQPGLEVVPSSPETVVGISESEQVFTWGYNSKTKIFGTGTLLACFSGAKKDSTNPGTETTPPEQILEVLGQTAALAIEIAQNPERTQKFLEAVSAVVWPNDLIVKFDKSREGEESFAKQGDVIISAQEALERWRPGNDSTYSFCANPERKNVAGAAETLIKLAELEEQKAEKPTEMSETLKAVGYSYIDHEQKIKNLAEPSFLEIYVAFSLTERQKQDFEKSIGQLLMLAALVEVAAVSEHPQTLAWKPIDPTEKVIKFEGLRHTSSILESAFMGGIPPEEISARKKYLSYEESNGVNTWLVRIQDITTDIDREYPNWTNDQKDEEYKKRYKVAYAQKDNLPKETVSLNGSLRNISPAEIASKAASWKTAESTWVPVNIKIDGRILVLTGANGAGKSSVLEALVEEMHILASTGLNLSATKAESPVLSSYYSAGAGSHSSTHSAFTETALGLAAAAQTIDAGIHEMPGFVVFDEVGKGTPSQAGVALELALALHALHNNSFAVISTHYAKELWALAVRAKISHLITFGNINSDHTYVESKTPAQSAGIEVLAYRMLLALSGLKGSEEFVEKYMLNAIKAVSVLSGKTDSEILNTVNTPETGSEKSVFMPTNMIQAIGFEPFDPYYREREDEDDNENPEIVVYSYEVLTRFTRKGNIFQRGMEKATQMSPEQQEEQRLLIKALLKACPDKSEDERERTSKAEEAMENIRVLQKFAIEGRHAYSDKEQAKDKLRGLFIDDKLLKSFDTISDLTQDGLWYGGPIQAEQFRQRLLALKNLVETFQKSTSFHDEDIVYAWNGFNNSNKIASGEYNFTFSEYLENAILGKYNYNLVENKLQQLTDIFEKGHDRIKFFTNKNESIKDYAVSQQDFRRFVLESSPVRRYNSVNRMTSVAGILQQSGSLELVAKGKALIQTSQNLATALRIFFRDNSSLSPEDQYKKWFSTVPKDLVEDMELFDQMEFMLEAVRAIKGNKLTEVQWTNGEINVQDAYNYKLISEFSTRAHEGSDTPKKSVTPQSFVMDESDMALIVGGLNGDGKTRYLENLAQILFMAQILGYVPAESAKLPKNNFVRYFVNQDRATKTQSSFTAEADAIGSFMQEYLASGAPRNGVFIVDEPFSGTSSWDQVANIMALIEFLSSRNVKLIFTNHNTDLYKALGKLRKTDGNSIDYSLAFFNEEGTFKPTIVDTSNTEEMQRIINNTNAFKVARSMGVPENIIALAEHLATL